MTPEKPSGPRDSMIEWQRGATIFVCALMVALSLALRGNSCGHDFDFHIQSWLAVAQQWPQGTLYPHWTEGANYGAGEPRFVFYPPLSWMLGTALGMVFGWFAPPIVFTVVVLTACGLSMNKLAREWLTPNAAAVAACAYILNPYALFVAYERTAYAELAAGIWLPLIIFYALRKQPGICHPERSGAEWRDLRFQRFRAGTIPLALTIAAIWITNAPAAVMACYALAAITIWQSIAYKDWLPLLNSTNSLILGLGLASFYIVPAAYERRWVDIARAIGPGMRIEDSFLFGHTGESSHDQVLHAASLIFVTMTVAIFLFAWITWKRKTGPRLLLPVTLAVAGLFALQLPWSAIIWQLAPELKFLQFPWRWTLLLSVVFSISLGAAATRSSPQAEPNLGMHIVALVIAAISAVSLGTWLFWQPCDEEDVVSAQVAVFQAGTGFEGTDEYTPLGADNSLIQRGLPKLRLLDAADAEIAIADSNQNEGNPTYVPSDKDHLPVQARIERWLPEDKAMIITAQTPGFAVLRLMDYPAWQVLANGAPVLHRPHRDDGLLTVPLPVGSTRIDVRYAASPDVWWGRALSTASLLVLLGVWLGSQKRREVI
jgi:hypothetical protein